jgi:hypothetical protein
MSVVNRAFGHGGAFEQLSLPLQLLFSNICGMTQVGTTQVSTPQVSITQVSIAQECTPQVGSSQEGCAQVGQPPSCESRRIYLAALLPSGFLRFTLSEKVALALVRRATSFPVGVAVLTLGALRSGV